MLKQFLSIASKFLSDRRQRVCLDGKVSASVDVVSGVPQASVLRPLLCILDTSELFHIVGNRIECMRMILRSMQLFLDRLRVLK